MTQMPRMADAAGAGLFKSLKPAFAPQSDLPEGTLKLGREISPIYFMHSNMPPIVIIHGDEDTIVPVSQSSKFVQRCEKVHSTGKLIIREGKNHGWPEMDKDMRVLADWFDEYLRGPDKKP